MSRTLIMSLAAAAMLAATPAFAAPGTLTLVVGGDAYEGPPRFEVSFNGKTLGEGEVETAIDTATAGRFADAKAKAEHLQSFEFAIPEEVFSPTAFVRIRFLNDAAAGAGSVQDRNLYLYSVTVNGRPVPADELTTIGEQGRVPSPMLGQYLALPDGSISAVASAPSGGWPAPEGTAVPSAPAAQVAAVPVPAEAPPATATAVVAPKVAPAVVDAVTTASVRAQPEVSQCALDQIYNVVGFNENSNDLTQRLTDRLDQILTDIGDNTCVVQVVGYSSTLGDYATNALFAVERAQNVLTYLRRNGLEAAKSTATGAGETEQFGSEPNKNRRVVITVTP